MACRPTPSTCFHKPSVIGAQPQPHPFAYRLSEIAPWNSGRAEQLGQWPYGPQSPNNILSPSLQNNWVKPSLKTNKDADSNSPPSPSCIRPHPFCAHAHPILSLSHTQHHYVLLWCLLLLLGHELFKGRSHFSSCIFLRQVIVNKLGIMDEWGRDHALSPRETQAQARQAEQDCLTADEADPAYWVGAAGTFTGKSLALSDSCPCFPRQSHFRSKQLQKHEMMREKEEPAWYPHRSFHYYYY